MTAIRRLVLGLLVGFFVGSMAFAASAAHFQHCREVQSLDRCYPMYLEEIEVPIPKGPGPYTMVQIGAIAQELSAVLEPDVEPWFAMDMTSGQVTILDMTNEVAYVPEPGELTLLCSGIAGLAVFGRKRRA